MGSALVPGQIFAGYRIERLLGAGGMGEVFLAHDRGLPRYVALKVLTRAVGDEHDMRKRFQREADMVARLSHPNIVTIYARGEERGQLWIAMAFVDGTDLAAVLEAGPVAPERAVRIVTAAADALDHAHDIGVLHRDVKPANILLSRPPSERVLLTDFGIAKGLEDSVVLTRTNELYASFQYTAPERFDFESVVDNRADVYSLGCTLYHMLTGAIPYPGTSAAQLIYGHLNRPAPKPSEHNPALTDSFDAVIARALAKDPAERYPDCASFAEAVARAWSRGAAQVLARPTEGYASYPPTISDSRSGLMDATGGSTPAVAPARKPRRVSAPILAVGIFVTVVALGAVIFGVFKAVEHFTSPSTSVVAAPDSPAAQQALVGKWQGVAQQDDAGTITRYRMTINLRAGAVGTVVGTTLYEVPGGTCSGELTLRQQAADGRSASYYEQVVAGPCIPNGNVTVSAAANGGVDFTYTGVTRAGKSEKVTAGLDRVG